MAPKRPPPLPPDDDGPFSSEPDVELQEVHRDPWEPGAEPAQGWHTPSDMSAEEIMCNERESRRLARSWTIECEATFNVELAQFELFRVYTRIFGYVVLTADAPGDEEYDDEGWARSAPHLRRQPLAALHGAFFTCIR